MKSSLQYSLQSRIYLGLTLWSFLALGAGAQGPPILKLETDAGVELGLPIVWSEAETLLLRNDGSLLSLPRAKIRSHQKTPESFRWLNYQQMRVALQNEFGSSWEVVGRDNYLVVATPGTGEVWLERLALLKSRFHSYFSVRGFSLEIPSVPLVAIVLPSQREFQKYASKNGVQIDGSTLGFYSILSNRMLLYDRKLDSSAWFSTATTILHETTHQLAFNSGMHKRLSQNPLWAVEGLASLFESPGMIQTQGSAEVSARANPPRLATWVEMRSNTKQIAKWLDELVEKDRLFETHPDQAYAISWALAFYLAERDSSHLVEYYKHLSGLKQGKQYSAPERRADFQRMIHRDTYMLVKSMDRFLMDLDL